MVLKQDEACFQQYAIRSALFFSAMFLIQSTVNSAERQGLLMNASVAVENDDNILRTSEATSDTIFKLSPDIEYLLNVGKHEFLLDYQGNYLSYSDNDSFNFNSHDAALTAIFEHSHRAKTELSASYEETTEDPGSTNSTANLNLEKFNEFSRKSALAKFYYGTRQSIGQLVFSLQHADKVFKNNQQEFRNEDSWKLTNIFFYKSAPKTRLFIETTWGQYDYKLAPSSQQNDTISYLLGVEWLATAKTSGTFKVGYETKDYDDNNTVSGLSYLLDMNWQPLTFTKVILEARRESKNSAEVNVRDYISTSFSLAVVNNLSDRTKLSTGYSLSNDEVASSIDRTDKTESYKFGLIHGIQKWLRLGLDYSYKKRDSGLGILKYKANIIELSLTSTFD